MAQKAHPKFGQLLVSNDKQIRDKAVKSLTQFLKHANDIDELELSKMWKALFYCMWHSDKRAAQADLAERLAAIMHMMPQPKRFLYVQVFWSTMMREWHGIDRLRLDKFYMLLRCALEHSLVELRTQRWELETVHKFCEVLRRGPLCDAAPKGLRYFLIDSMVTALQKVVGSDAASGSATSELLMALLEPFIWLLGAADEPHIRQRITDKVFDALLEQACASDDQSDKTILPLSLTQLSERLFSLASDRHTREENRDHIYKLQRKVEAKAEEVTPKPTPAVTATTALPKGGNKKEVPDDSPQLQVWHKIIRSGAKRRVDTLSAVHVVAKKHRAARKPDAREAPSNVSSMKRPKRADAKPKNQRARDSKSK
mmetsp:Transcript_8710/g.14635  ORF Transcript_8710/g.14635 Transcript_8710/m.14635 type:complete len:370 (-) Transcript_8710:171-1280(-)|eukprot:CAMPEP_0119326350 /NCGR_PEP_ID=MMETSP1333-20130426/68174_1 /TAXON_ID=418940 /ORGANISM="Scyphosphaera apsteinii, Strain RCC1455" /LENGTH=369 /DNA_ID=CAMNT_0007334637 /DNA_START=46 /DNA_END=1155 /DNA_ORIENTATION=+